MSASAKGGARVIVRAYRPLRELTDNELHALVRIGESSRILADALIEPLCSLALLANDELGHRELAAELTKAKP